MQIYDVIKMIHNNHLSLIWLKKNKKRQTTCPKDSYCMFSSVSACCICYGMCWSLVHHAMQSCNKYIYFKPRWENTYCIMHITGQTVWLSKYFLCGKEFFLFALTFIVCILFFGKAENIVLKFYYDTFDTSLDKLQQWLTSFIVCLFVFFF